MHSGGRVRRVPVEHRWLGLDRRTLPFAAVAVTLVVLRWQGTYSTRLMVPFIKGYRPNLIIDSLMSWPHLWPLAFLPFVIFVMLVITGSSNAVNKGIRNTIIGDKRSKA